MDRHISLAVQSIKFPSMKFSYSPPSFVKHTGVATRKLYRMCTIKLRSQCCSPLTGRLRRALTSRYATNRFFLDGAGFGPFLLIRTGPFTNSSSDGTPSNTRSA